MKRGLKVWFGAAYANAYPAKGTLTKGGAAPRVGNMVSVTLSDPGGSGVTILDSQWQIRDNANSVHSDIHDAGGSMYTPVAADIGKQIRCGVHYKNAKGFMLAAVSDWSDAVVV